MAAIVYPALARPPLRLSEDPENAIVINEVTGMECGHGERCVLFSKVQRIYERLSADLTEKNWLRREIDNELFAEASCGYEFVADSLH